MDIIYCTEARAKRLRPPRREVEAVSALSPVIGPQRLGHPGSRDPTWPPHCENLPMCEYTGGSSRCNAGSYVNRPQIRLCQDAGGDISPPFPLFLFVHLF